MSKYLILLYIKCVETKQNKESLDFIRNYIHNNRYKKYYSFFFRLSKYVHDHGCLTNIQRVALQGLEKNA